MSSRKRCSAKGVFHQTVMQKCLTGTWGLVQSCKDPSYMGHKSSQIFCFWTGLCIFAGQQSSDLAHSMEGFPVGFEEMGSQKRLHIKQLEKWMFFPKRQSDDPAKVFH